MKWVFLSIAAVALIAVSLSVPAPVLSSKAFAGKMNGKPGDGNNHRSGMAHYDQPTPTANAKKNKGH